MQNTSQPMLAPDLSANARLVGMEPRRGRTTRPLPETGRMAWTAGYFTEIGDAARLAV